MEDFYDEAIKLTKETLIAKDKEAYQTAEEPLKRAKEIILNAAHNGLRFCYIPTSELNDTAYQTLIEMGFHLSKKIANLGANTKVLVSWEEGLK